MSRMQTVHSLAGQVAVVTGAGRGIGRAIALGYGRAGAAVCCAARNVQELEDVVGKIRRAGGDALAVPTDVTDLRAVEALFARATETFGGIDIVMINAGVSAENRGVAESDPEQWRTVLEVNLFGAYNCARSAVPHLRARGGGKIITMGSGLGHRGLAGGSAYSCSKAGLWMLTRVLAQEVWQDNISVNELIPGPVETSISDRSAGGVSNISSEWSKKPEDVVPLALFLASQPTVGPTAQSFSLMRRDM